MILPAASLEEEGTLSQGVGIDGSYDYSEHALCLDGWENATDFTPLSSVPIGLSERYR